MPPRTHRRIQTPKATSASSETSKEALALDVQSWIDGTAEASIDVANYIAHSVWQVKNACWSGEKVGDSQSREAWAEKMQRVGQAITSSFNRFKAQKRHSKEVSKDDIEVGLLLCCIYFDGIAIPGTSVMALPEGLGVEALQFIKAVLGGPKPNFATLARTFRSIHHALAARRFTSMSWCPALPQLIAPLLWGKACPGEPSPAVVEALEDLSAALCCLPSDARLVERTFGDAVEGLSASSKPAKLLPLALQATATACLPRPLPKGDKTDESEDIALLSDTGLRARMKSHFSIAQDRASALVSGLLQRCLIEGPLQKELMGRLEQALDALLLLLLDTENFTAAPLMLLLLINGLASIASANRHSDLGWEKREFSLKLIGTAVGRLSEGRAKAAGEGGIAATITDAGLPAYLTDWSKLCLARALVPPRTKGNGTSKGCTLRSCAIPSNDAIHSLSFALCSLVSAGTGGGNPQVFKIVSKCWLTLADPQELISQRPIGGGGGAALQSKTSHWRHWLWSGDGFLSKALKLSLETCSKLAAGSPLAHVRRQGLLGFAQVCGAEPAMLVGGEFPKVLAMRLNDDSAFVRASAVQVVSKLAETSPNPTVSELVRAARTRLSDTAPSVRYASLRLVCATAKLEREEDGKLFGELLSRSASEGENYRNHVLKALDNAIFSSGGSSVVERLAILASSADVPKSVFSELFGARRAMLTDARFDMLAKVIIDDHIDRLTQTDTKPESATMIGRVLQSLAELSPDAFEGHLTTLLDWLTAKPDINIGKDHRRLEACKLLKIALPNWVSRGERGEVEHFLQQLQASLLELLEVTDLPLLREAARAYVALACCGGKKRSLDLAEFLDQVEYAMTFLRGNISSSGHDLRQLSIGNQRRLGQSLWFVTTAAAELWEADRKVLSDLNITVESLRQFAAEILKILNRIGLGTSLSMRYCALPCAGFLASAFPALLQSSGGEDPAGESLLKFFSESLRVPELVPRCLEALVDLMSALQAKLDLASTAGQTGPSSQKVPATTKAMTAAAATTAVARRSAAGVDPSRPMQNPNQNQSTLTVALSTLSTLQGLVLQSLRAAAVVPAASEGSAAAAATAAKAAADGVAAAASQSIQQQQQHTLQLQQQKQQQQQDQHRLQQQQQSASTIWWSVRLLEAIHRVGLLHLATALPELLGCSFLVREANLRSLIAKLVSNSPEMFLHAVPKGIRAGATLLVAQASTPTDANNSSSTKSNNNNNNSNNNSSSSNSKSTSAPPPSHNNPSSNNSGLLEPSQRWRFLGFLEASGVSLETAQQREGLLDALTNELKTRPSDQGGQVASGEVMSRDLTKLELIFGLLNALSWKSEQELGFVCRWAHSYVSLKVSPFLHNDQDEESGEQGTAPDLHIHDAAVVLAVYHLCNHWASKVDVNRLLTAPAERAGGGHYQGTIHLPSTELSEGFEAIRRILGLEASGRSSALRSLLLKTVEADSWLVTGKAGRKSATRKRALPKSAAQPETKAKPKKRAKQ